MMMGLGCLTEVFCILPFGKVEDVLVLVSVSAEIMIFPPFSLWPKTQKTQQRQGMFVCFRWHVFFHILDKIRTLLLSGQYQLI